MSEGGIPFMTRGMQTHQRKVVTMFAKITGATVAGGTLTTNGLDTGAALHMKVTETGSGVYALTLNDPGARFVGASFTSMTTLAYCHFAVTTDGKVITVTQRTATTGAALADADISCVMFVSYAPDAT